MRQFLRDGNHLLRVAGIFGFGIVVFLLLRAWLVPADFGRYGHYRAGALADNLARAVRYAGKAACLDCHTDVADSQKGSHHASVSCETCHGALARHADNPEIQPAKLDPATLCVTCHRATPGRPAKFPQIHPKEHSAGAACTSCHKPHHPEQEEQS